MRLLALLLAVGLVGCVDAASVEALHKDIDLLGQMARSSDERTPELLAGVTACVTSAHRRLQGIAPIRSRSGK